MKKKQKKQKTSTARKIWREWGRPVVLAVVFVVTFRTAVADWNYVPSGSMKPTLYDGDMVLVNKLAYDLKLPLLPWRLAAWDEPGRGDVVIFYSPAEKTRFVKRVIGLPGDVIALRNNRLFVNDVPVNLTPSEREFPALTPEEQSATVAISEELETVNHPILLTPSIPSARDYGPIRVPEGQFFVLGDHRDNSRDSRYLGFVPREQITGRAWATLFSVDPDSFYWPRWSRTLQSFD